MSSSGGSIVGVSVGAMASSSSGQQLQQLQHLVKGRPRKAKTRAPSRPMFRPADSTDTSDLGEGLDTFFRPGSVTPTTPLVSPTSDDSSSHAFPMESEAESTEDDRDRRNGGLGVLREKPSKWWVASVLRNGGNVEGFAHLGRNVAVRP